MAVAKSSNSNTESSLNSCSCYKVANLSETILDANHTANLHDRYVLGEQLGWGQFGIIRTCSDKFTGEVLACKSIAKNRLVTQEDVRSVKLEIEIMTRLSGHPNVVDLKAVYEEEDYVHLVMELCAGGELFHQLERHGRFSEAEARVLFHDLMEVVMYCHHKGIVHRDLKPENILLATKGSSSPIKLADFGLATYIKPVGVEDGVVFGYTFCKGEKRAPYLEFMNMELENRFGAKTGQSLHGTVGSPFYIAPEVLAGGYNQAADIWSAGVILYILLSGIPPFWGKTKSKIFDAVRAADLRFPSDRWDTISSSAKELIEGMLCTDPSQRLTTQQILDHAWVRNSSPHFNEPCLEVHSDEGSCCSSLMARNQDISFGTGSAVLIDVQSPKFTCRSSFSTLLTEQSTTSYESAVFSFSSTGGSNGHDFASPVLTLPSFTFFGSSLVVDQGSYEVDLSVRASDVDLLHKDAIVEKVFMLSDSPVGFEQVVTDKTAEARTSGSNGSRTLGIQSWRNHTIGLGESEQIDITDSVIRWASCTCLPTATSLRSSLVC